MSRMSRAALAALALAGGACLITGTAQASNMGFKLERSFDVNRTPTGLALRNEYWVSEPLFNGLGDVGYHDPAPGFGNKRCVDATNPVGDGVVDVLDMLCDHWTARTTATPGAFQIQYINTADCTSHFFQGAYLGTNLRLNGEVFPLRPDIGYQINVSAPAGQSPRNPAVIVGSHDPSFTGHVVAPGLSCGATAVNQDYLNLPYHTMYQTANEILCGLINVDWTPAGAAGDPDRCFNTAASTATGIFDGTHVIQVQTMKPDGTPDFRQVTLFAGNLRFNGTNFALIPGEAYKAVLSRLHVTTTFLSPHF